MNNIKCPYCGFINFVTAEVCRKCETVLQATGGAETYQEPAGYRTESGYGSGYSSQRYALAPQKTKVPIFKIIGVVFLIGVVSAVGLGLLAYNMRIKWQMLQPDGSDLIFWMPGQFTSNDTAATPTPMGIMTKRISVATLSGQGTATLAVVNFSRGFSFSRDMTQEQVLEAELDNFLKATNSTLVSKNLVTVYGMKALEFEMKPGEAGVANAKGYGKLILGSSRVYLAALVANEGSSLDRQKDKFLNPERMYNSSY